MNCVAEILASGCGVRDQPVERASDLPRNSELISGRVGWLHTCFHLPVTDFAKLWPRDEVH